jgi:hypothetical protein
LDARTETAQDVTLQPQYSVSLLKGTHENRFYLVFSHKPPGLYPFFGDVFDAYGAEGNLHVLLYLKSGGQGEIMVTNMTGQLILKRPISGFGLHAYEANWSTGVYVVSFVSKEGIFSKKVVIANK